MGTRRVAFAKTLALVWVVAIFSGCQRQESPQSAVVEPETQAEATGPAWVDARRIANADTEPHNWLVLSDDDVEAIRAFVVRQANLTSN